MAVRFLHLALLPALGFAADDSAALRIIETSCLGCHGPAKMGGLDLTTRESALQGGARGAAFVPGNAAASLLIQAVEGSGPVKMPPGKQTLAASEVVALRAWVNAGAGWNGVRKAAPSWWSFRPLKRPVPPSGGHPIDAFIGAKLGTAGLKPVAQAPKRTLIRRAYYRLHGLPPPPEEVEAFEADTDPRAWDKLIGRLLDSKRYGERWGRHWLDVVRYADTGGFETDIYFPNAWRYRDYVIEAFNDDKPYFHFVQEQVAGDELWPDDLALDGGFKVPDEKARHRDARIATGMFTIGPVYHEAGLFGGQQRYEWLTDVVDTTGEAFLGLTLGCARCHDHKFDPLTSRDYHAMMAVFAASDEREVPVIPKFNIYGFKSGFPRWLKVEEIKSAIGRIDAGARKRVVDKVRAAFDAGALRAYDTRQAERTPEQNKLAAKVEAAMTEAGLQENARGRVADIPYTAEESSRRAELMKQLAEAALKANPVLPTATVLGPADKVYDIFLTSRGDWRSKGPKIDPALPAALAGGTPVDPRLRRKSLALWLTDSKNALPARVMANRIWHWQFGRGIVGTPNDFGRQGDPPSHPELLDWLAAELVANGGSIKKLQKLIMTSDAWQRDSSDDASNASIDAGNRLLWRANRTRIDAETLRDSVIAASGSLNTRMGGRPVVPPLTSEEYASMWQRDQWPETMDLEEQNRRSVYLYVKRSFLMPMFTSFDAPDTSVSCARRDSTTVAPQALTLMNSEFMMRYAARLAARATGHARSDEERVASAWNFVLQRPPTASELQRSLGFLRDGGSSDAALTRLCLVLFNLNEFLYTD